MLLTSTYQTSNNAFFIRLNKNNAIVHRTKATVMNNFFSASVKHAIMFIAFMLSILNYCLAQEVKGQNNSNAATLKPMHSFSSLSENSFNAIEQIKQHPEKGWYKYEGCTDCKERTELRTANSRTFEKADGTIYKQEFNEAVHVLKDGFWISIEKR